MRSRLGNRGGRPRPSTHMVFGAYSDCRVAKLELTPLTPVSLGGLSLLRTRLVAAATALAAVAAPAFS